YLADDHNAAAQMVDRVADALRGLGHEVMVHRSFGPALHGADVDRGVAARRKPSARLRNAVWFARALGRNRPMYRHDLGALRAFRPDVVLARQDAYCMSMPRAARRLGVPVVTYADAPVAYETRVFAAHVGRWHPPGLVEAIERWTLRQSRAVVTVSHPAAR